MFKPHECGDSRLKCVDCEGQVCPKCFVECPVGNRCKQCAAKFNSHVLNVGVGQLVLMFVVAFVIGAGFGVAQGFIPGGGFFMWFIVYALGVAAGNIIHKVIGFKIGTKVMATATVAVLMGWAGAMHYGPQPNLVEQATGMRESVEESAATFKLAMLNQYRHFEDKETAERLAYDQAEAQERLPEMVAAFNRHEPCYVLARTTPGAKAANYEWLRVVGATNDHITGASDLSDSASTNIANADVLNWQFTSPKIGAQGGSLHMVNQKNIEPMVNEYKKTRMSWALLDAVIFLAGIITILSGQAPALRLPFFRN